MDMPESELYSVHKVDPKMADTGRERDHTWVTYSCPRPCDLLRGRRGQRLGPGPFQGW